MRHAPPALTRSITQDACPQTIAAGEGATLQQIDRGRTIRLDYNSTREALGALYDRVAPGGSIIVDGYQVLAACRQAVDEFRAARQIGAPIWRIDQEGVYWRKLA